MPFPADGGPAAPVIGGGRGGSLAGSSLLDPLEDDVFSGLRGVSRLADWGRALAAGIPEGDVARKVVFSGGTAGSRCGGDVVMPAITTEGAEDDGDPDREDEDDGDNGGTVMAWPRGEAMGRGAEATLTVPTMGGGRGHTSRGLSKGFCMVLEFELSALDGSKPDTDGCSRFPGAA